ncbi:hypothetical protein Rhopal_001230-T1 [Rhodotorula paludigena]|uniref:Uncharacterized protein n=1 Tax=Rhodotorula paludigena TaxID=86838 RepID=A0AAV5G713_9BASI|nr:hypothetical protein Rhopal_001230-T1 [Rhodotorula paludigena]
MGTRFSPALGETTVVPLLPPSVSSSSTSDKHTVYFTCQPENGEADGKVVQVWTNLPTSAASTGEPAWRALSFSPAATASSRLRVASTQLPADRSAGSYEYTFRLCDETTGDVEWLGSEGSNGRIEIVDVTPEHLAATAIAGEGWTALADGVSAWSGALGDGQDEATFDVSVVCDDEVWKDAEGVVWEQSSRTWFQPRQLPSPSPIYDLSKNFPAQLIVLRSKPSVANPLEHTLVLFPFSTKQACSALFGDEAGGIELRVERDGAADDSAAIEGHLVAVSSVTTPGSPTLQDLVNTAVAAARSIRSGSSFGPSSSSPLSSEVNEPKPLGACTWNSLPAADYSATSVLSWLDSLLSPTTSPSPLFASAMRTVLLDDGWQDVGTFVDFDAPDQEHADRRALKSFQCGKEWDDLDSVAASDTEDEGALAAAQQHGKKFSLDSGYAGSPTMPGRQLVERAREGVCEELREVVGRVKEKSIDKVGVWVTLAGYWHGLHPDSSLADAYTLRRIKLRSSAHPGYSGHAFLPIAAELPIFYRDYFSSLAAAGVDFVKVDDQAIVDAIVAQDIGDDEDSDAQPDSPGELRQVMLTAMQEAATEVFGAGGILHCMSGSPRIWGGALLSSTSRPTVRSSDDFFPLERDSHRWHIANNALTAVFANALGIEPDFDMVQGAQACDFGEAHLVLRAFFSAQVFSTDPALEEGASETSGWDSLLATTKRGIRVLQSRTPAVAGATLDGALADDALDRQREGTRTALKVGLPVPAAVGAHIGVWDCLPLEQGDESSRETQVVLDDKDVADAVSQLDLGGKELVLYDPQAKTGTTVDADALKGRAALPRALAKPLATVAVSPTQPRVVTLASLFPLQPTSTGGSGIKIACLGLTDKTVGLAAIRTAGVGVGGVKVQVETVVEQIKGSAEALGSKVAGVSTAPASSALSPSPSTFTATRSSQPFPHPQGRLPYLLAYFAGAFRHAAVHTSSTSTSSSTAATRTPRTELRALARDLVHRPFRTVLGELRALVSFGLAAVLWAVGAARTQASAANGVSGERRVLEDVTPGQEEEGEPREVPLPGPAFRVELDYLSKSLAFFVSPPDDSASLRFTLDARTIDPVFVRTHSSSETSGEIVELDVEGEWNKRIGSRPAPQADKEDDEALQPWVVEVCVVEEGGSA